MGGVRALPTMATRLVSTMIQAFPFLRACIGPPRNGAKFSTAARISPRRLRPSFSASPRPARSRHPADRAPEVEEVIGVLEQPGDHCIVSFFSVEKQERPEYFNKLFRALAELRGESVACLIERQRDHHAFAGEDVAHPHGEDVDIAQSQLCFCLR